MIATCWAEGCETLPERAKNQISYLVVHRIEVSQEDKTFLDSPSDVARFFRNHPIGHNATGGAMPYPILIDALGQVTQTVGLGRVTPHVRSYNPQAIGIGVLGDFRQCTPQPAQYQALVQVLKRLVGELSLPVTAIVGHDELAGGSSDPNKECPGRSLPLPLLREAVAQALTTQTILHGAFAW